jgi:7-cyano-7-deazaguanine synthase
LKTVVLLSGGLDSVVNLACAREEGEVVRAITFDYGQAAFGNEVAAAIAVAERYSVPHAVVSLPWYRDIVANPVMGKGLVSRHAGTVPGDPDELLKEAWIPNRNCVFLSMGAAYAESLGACGVVMGLNREEAAIFPDNSVDFLENMNRVLELSTLSGVQALCYTIGMTKREIVELGARSGAPLDLLYSCYQASADQRMCGLCQSCVRVKAALRDCGLLERYGGRFAA